MRGKIGQDPMIIDVPYATSSDSGSTVSRDSDDSSGPETPPTDSDNRDRRYVWKPEPGIPIPQAYDIAKKANPVAQKSTTEPQNRERGRRPGPKLDTDLARSKSTAEPLPPLERARSAYASGPHDRKPKPDHFSGEYLLSPDMMSPRKAYADSPRNQSQFFPRPAEVRAGDRSDQGRDMPRQPTRPSLQTHRAHSHYLPRPVEVHHEAKDSHGTDSPRAGTRPPVDRRASDLPYSDHSPTASRRPTLDSKISRHPLRSATDKRPAELPYPANPPPVSVNRQRYRRPPGSLDDSDSDHARSPVKSSQVSPRTPPRHPVTITSKDGRHHERKFSAELPPSPLKRSMASSDGGDRPVNLSSLVSGAAVTQTLNAMLGGDDHTARRASPRPSPAVSPLASPHGSPKSSPYPSPPRTPTSESFQCRSNPIVGLKKDSPSSRPSSPLSSPSSLWTAEPDSSPREGENSVRSRPGLPKSRKAAPLPTQYTDRQKDSELLEAPGIVVRSPSPAKHTKSFSAQTGEPRQSKAGSGDEAPDHRSRSSILRPTGLSGRQRSASSTDVRPRLNMNTTPFLQASDSSQPSHFRSRPASPSLASPSQRYKPSELEPTSSATGSRSSRLESVSSSSRARSRSRSYVPEPTSSAQMTNSSTLPPSAPALRSRSTMPVPASSTTRSRSSAPQAVMRELVPVPPASLPKCPRPEAVAGHDDWYTLHDNGAFAICPTCRDTVFGVESSSYLQPRAVSTRKTLCDLNNPWVRLALTLRGPDVKILSALSNVTLNDRSCPGDDLAPRDWYRLEDPESGKHIAGFNACPHCVHSLETLLPAWRNVFYRSRSSHSHELKERFCAFRASPNRFGDYLNMVVESAQEADSKRKVPSTVPVRELVKQLAGIDDCPKDAMFPRKAWHIHPHLPEFTICQECYENAVYPLVKQGLALAAKIDNKPHQFPNPDTQVCCHLYSPRMRRVFREACEDDDYEHLRHTVLRRHMLQQDILGTFEEMKEHPGDGEVDDRLRELLAKWKDKE